MNCPYFAKEGNRFSPFGIFLSADRKGDLDCTLVSLHRKRIRDLERECAEFKAKYHALHQRQFKANRKKRGDRNEEAAAGKASGTKEKKRLGAPAGHPGWYRPKPTEIDRTVRVPLAFDLSPLPIRPSDAA